jgi:nitrogen fixation protein NifB
MDKYLAAVASSDMKNVDMHFGKCRVFTVAAIDPEGGRYRIIGQRSVNPPCPSCGTKGEPDDAINSVVEALSDCRLVIVSRIGRWPDSLLFERGIESVQYIGPIDRVLEYILGRDRAKM